MVVVHDVLTVCMMQSSLMMFQILISSVEMMLSSVELSERVR